MDELFSNDLRVADISKSYLAVIGIAIFSLETIWKLLNAQINRRAFRYVRMEVRTDQIIEKLRYTIKKKNFYLTL